MRESMKGYLVLAVGLALLARDRTFAAARRVAAHGEATAGQVQQVAEDFVSTSRGNREALISLIRYEIDRALGRMGLASADEVAALRARVRTLEAHMRTVTGAPPAKKQAAARPAKRTASAAGAARVDEADETSWVATP